MVARILRSLVDSSRIRSMDGHRKYHVFDSIEFVTAITYKLTGTIRYNKQFDFQVYDVNNFFCETLDVFDID